MATFAVNKDLSGVHPEIEAQRFVTNGDFVDFMNAGGQIVYRIASSQVVTIERVTE